MRPCSQCRRHVLAADRACPFCDAPLAPAGAAILPARATRAALFAGALAIPGCWTGSAPPTEPTPRYAEPPDGQRRPADPPRDRAPPPAFTARIRGIVTDARTGSPMANVNVTIQSVADPHGRVAGNTQTDGRGEYVFDELPAGKYVVRFPPGHPRQGPQQRQVELHEGETRQVDMTLYVYVPSHLPTPYGAPPARRRVV
jgi:hypothetical protein